MPPHRKSQKRFLSKEGPTPAERRWRPVVEEWQRSGQEISAFCRQRHLPIVTVRRIQVSGRARTSSLGFGCQRRWSLFEVGQWSHRTMK